MRDDLNGPDAPLDDVDVRLLADMRRLWDEVDPVPAELFEQVRFAMDLTQLDFDLEVLRMSTAPQLAAVRGEERARLITFDSESLTIMISTRANPDGSVRIDGWLTPAADHPVDLRMDSGIRSVTADMSGRFSFESVPAGMAQLMVRPAESGRLVTTPTISL